MNTVQRQRCAISTRSVKQRREKSQISCSAKKNRPTRQATSLIRPNQLNRPATSLTRSNQLDRSDSTDLRRKLSFLTMKSGNLNLIKCLLAATAPEPYHTIIIIREKHVYDFLFFSKLVQLFNVWKGLASEKISNKKNFVGLSLSC